MSNDRDDHLAYGDYHGGTHEESGERGLIGDFGRRFLGQRPEAEPSDITQEDRRPHHLPFLHHPAQPQGQPDHYEPYSTQKPPQMASFFNKIGELITGHDEESAQTTHEQVSEVAAETAQEGAQQYADHRFLSFAPKRHDNNVKWFVDGCGYMWAVSEALERAKESIWILDWWLSPELYLRRPPAKNQSYRLDRLLQAAAERGVKVNIIVYKEVEQALTLSSKHTKHHLEALHENIAVQRHPDHYVDHNTLTQDLIDQFKGFNMSAKSISSAPWDAFKAIYGSTEDTVLFWAHHEKLCIVDGETVFMGGLDLCYGRWDTNQHQIADVHPGDLNEIVWPGQDYNNARIMDFQDVENWQNNKLDRQESSRMGWSDVALCMNGPIIADLQEHFTQRWNYIFHEKYKIKNDGRFQRLSVKKSAPQADEDLAYGEEESGHGFRKTFTNLSHHAHHQWENAQHHLGYGQTESEGERHEGSNDRAGTGKAAIQLTRSCAEWSHGVQVEHSIQNAYIENIKNSKHFIYIENQFFITATGEDQKPIKNMIGAAIVERVLRAHKNGEKWKGIIMIPAVPAFPGDLKADEALSTRAIMEFQYKSINRGKGKSIYETIAAEGINPMDYLRFYNLRNYDRLNISGSLEDAEENAGVTYEEGREEHDRQYGGRYAEREGEEDGYPRGDENEENYEDYQRGARNLSRDRGLGSGRWDSVAECYMLGGEDLRNVPWSGSTPEIDAFITEELYIHSKLLIVDDRIVICGSANLNDRSQLGNHDSEIAVVIEDPTPVDSWMDGQEWRASKFAASLRRQLMRKHLGLLPAQDYRKPNENFHPIGVPNVYDWNSLEDLAVADPISDRFLDLLWNKTAKTNTDSFAEVFHAVPYDGVRTWDQYDEYYERYFKDDNKEKKEKDEEAKEDDGHEGKPRRYKRGHVISENFAPGEDGARQVKDILARIRGTLVEMPLLFLKDEDVAKNGVQLNAFTEEVYT